MGCDSSSNWIDIGPGLTSVAARKRSGSGSKSVTGYAGLGNDRQMLIDPDMLQAAPELDLLAAYESILAELARRKVVRTNDSPVGQYAEAGTNAALTVP